jgi:hypothetical protein
MGGVVVTRSIPAKSFDATNHSSFRLIPRILDGISAVKECFLKMEELTEEDRPEHHSQSVTCRRRLH